MNRLPSATICLIVGALLFACTRDNARSSSSGAYAAAPQTGTMQIDTSKAANSYANFCRVTGTPEEVIVDFGLNATPIGVPADPIKIDERIVMNFYTAKRLLTALEMTIRRHEETFGELELDVQKRVK